MHQTRWTAVAAFATLTLIAAACSGDEARDAPSATTASPGAASASPAASGTTTATAEIANFTLPSLRVTVGTVVEFANKDSAPHTATSDDKTTFDSKTLAPGTGRYRFTAAKAGTYPYACMIHPNMTGTITVQ